MSQIFTFPESLLCIYSFLWLQKGDRATRPWEYSSDWNEHRHDNGMEVKSVRGWGKKSNQSSQSYKEVMDIYYRNIYYRI